MTTLSEGLAFTLFIGAARADATAEQVGRLRAEVMPLLDAYRVTGDESPVRQKVREIMGAGWEPTGDWAAQIGRLQQ